MQVVLRYVFKNSIISLQDSQWYLYAIALLMSVSYTTSLDGQVRVDFIYRRFSDRRRRFVDIVSHMVFLLPLYSFLFWEGWQLTANSFRLGESSGNVGGLPALWLVKSFIPIGSALLILSSLASIRILFGGESIKSGKEGEYHDS